MPNRSKGAWLYLISLLAVAALSLLSRVPFRLLTAMGGGLGALYYHLDRRRKKIGMANLRLALGKNTSEQELKQILRTVYKNMGRSMMEFAGLSKLSPEKIRGWIRVKGLEKLEAAREAGQGVILLTAHFGNWELFAQGLALYGYPASGVMRRANVPVLNNFIVRCRESHGNRVIYRFHAVRKVLKLLKQGGRVGMMCDQRGSTSRGIMVDFFGHPAPTNPTIAKMILRSNARVMMALAVRNPDQTHTIYIEDPLEISRTEDPEKDVLDVTSKYMNALEHFVRRYPDQWLWMHRRWMKRGLTAYS